MSPPPTSTRDQGDVGRPFDVAPRDGVVDAVVQDPGGATAAQSPVEGATLTTRWIATTMPESEERPWGSWLVLGAGDGYKVKRLDVKPHARLSLQTHVHRSEHWVVVAGVATCTVGSTQVVAGQGQRVDVPRGVPHRIANDRDEELVVVEVQLGEYTGEDDIVRLQDDYGRSTRDSAPEPRVVVPGRG